MKTAAASTVDQPVLTILDWVMLVVRTILSLMRKNSLFSSQLLSSSNSIPKVEANIAAARSSA